MIQDELQAASYRGAFFYLSTASTAGGRKDSLKEIVNSDNQIVEDLGKRQRSFTVNGVIAARVDTDGNELISYRDARDTLLAALEEGGRAILVHPFFGSIENVVCRTYSITESMQSVGVASITISFAISNTTGAPVAEDAVLGTVVAEADGAAAALETAVADDFSVTEAFIGNFSDALGKVNDFVEAVRAATDPIAQVASQVNEFASELSDLAANAASLVQAPAQLAESIQNVVNSMNGLFATPQAIFDSMKRLFDFGDLDVRFTTDTAGSQEKQSNRDLLNNQIQGAALASAYVAAAQLDLGTVQEIDATQEILEEQFQKMIATNSLASDAQEGLVKSRIALASYFNAQRADKPRIIEVETHTIPARVLAYQYYGDSSQGTRLAELNQLNDSAFAEGTVQILSA